MAESDEQRRCKRIELTAPVDLRRVKDFRYQSTLQNLSPTGCRVDLIDRVEVGDMVWVGLPGLESLLAKVRWADEWVAGIEFNRPIYPPVFDHIAARMAAKRRPAKKRALTAPALD